MSLLLVGCGGAGAANLTPGAGGAGTPTVGTSSARLVGTVTISSAATRSPIPPVTVPTPTVTAGAGGSTGGAPVNGATVVLTPANAGVTTTLKVGQVAQVQLPDARTWAYAGQTGAGLPGIAPSGVRSAGVYLWTFRAQTAGSVTLHFTGSMACEASNPPCLPADITLNFALRVVP